MRRKKPFPTPLLAPFGESQELQLWPVPIRGMEMGMVLVLFSIPVQLYRDWLLSSGPTLVMYIKLRKQLDLFGIDILSQNTTKLFLSFALSCEFLPVLPD